MAFEPEVSLKFLAALLALLNPLYGVPIFLSMTQGYSPAERNRTALIASLTVTVTALVATLIGEEVLSVFGIHIPSFRIAGNDLNARASTGVVRLGRGGADGP